MLYNIPQHISGDTWDGISSIQFLDDENVPVDITGCYIYMTVRASMDSPEILTLTSTDNEILIVDSTQGIISIKPKQINIPPAKYNWYLTINFPTTKSKTYIRGLWEIIPKVPAFVDVYDDINVVITDIPPTPTPTITPTPTLTPTPTPSNTPTNTPTSSNTPTPSNTPTQTQSGTPAETPTNTPTSETPTPTPTPTPTITDDGSVLVAQLISQ